MPSNPEGVHDIKTLNVNATADGANVLLAGVAGQRFIVVGGALVQTGAAASDLRSSGGTVKMTLAAGLNPLPENLPMDFPFDEGISTNNGASSDVTGVLYYYEQKRNI